MPTQSPSSVLPTLSSARTTVHSPDRSICADAGLEIASTARSWPRFTGSPVNLCFASDAEHLLQGVDLWVHGHTHDSFDYRVGATRVVCNPRGYVRDGVQENAHFDPALVVDVGQD